MSREKAVRMVIKSLNTRDVAIAMEEVEKIFPKKKEQREFLGWIIHFASPLQQGRLRVLYPNATKNIRETK